MDCGTIVSCAKTYNFSVGADGQILIEYDNTGVAYPVYTYTSGTLEFSFDTGALSSLSFCPTSSEYSPIDFDEHLLMLVTPIVMGGIGFNAEDTASYGAPVFTVNPYLVYNGEKYYFKSGEIIQVTDETPSYWQSIYIGAEVSCIINFNDTYYSWDSARALFGSATVSISLGDVEYTLYGTNIITTGEEYIIDNIQTQSNYLWELQNKLMTRISNHLLDIHTELQKQFPTVISALDSMILTLQEFAYDFNMFRIEISEQLTTMKEELVSKLTTIDTRLVKLNTYVMQISSILKDQLDVKLSDLVGNLSDWQASSSEQSATQHEEQKELQESGNQLQEEQNALQEEANKTSSNIFSKITDFFGGFFDNFMDSLKNLFVPDEEYFSDLFERMTDFFSEKLGALYAPIDILLTILDEFSSVEAVDTGIKFPGFKWEDVYIIEPQTIVLSDYVKMIPNLQNMIYFITDVIMVGAVLNLLQRKLREVTAN